MKSSFSDQISLIVFKGERPSRTFVIPLTWISIMSFSFGLLSVGILTLSILNTKLHLDLKKRKKEISTSTEVSIDKMAYEQKIAELTKKVEELTKKIEATPVATPSPDLSTPALVKGNVTIQDLKVHWTINKWNVSFDLVYTHQDGKSQQGRIVILASGPNMEMAYPKEALKNPKQGEFFSVSRLRPTRASFIVKNKSEILNFTIFIYNSDDQLIATQKMQAPQQ